MPVLGTSISIWILDILDTDTSATHFIGTASAFKPCIIVSTCITILSDMVPAYLLQLF